MLGGAGLEEGSWTGTWTPLPSEKAGEIKVTVPGASAAIVRLSLERKH